jgi:hypothetical protein
LSSHIGDGDGQRATGEAPHLSPGAHPS